MANIGQTIIIRTDIFTLPDDVGLLAAQVAHIHFETFRQRLLDEREKSKKDMNCLDANAISLTLTPVENAWTETPYIFVKQVPNAEGLNHFAKLARDSDVPVTEWNDTVYVRLSPTMKQAFPDTLVGISLGPCDADKIRTVVGDLPLL